MDSSVNTGASDELTIGAILQSQSMQNCQRTHRGAVEKSRGSVFRARCRQTGYLHR